METGPAKKRRIAIRPLTYTSTKIPAPDPTKFIADSITSPIHRLGPSSIDAVRLIQINNTINNGRKNVARTMSPNDNPD